MAAGIRPNSVPSSATEQTTDAADEKTATTDGAATTDGTDTAASDDANQKAA